MYNIIGVINLTTFRQYHDLGMLIKVARQKLNQTQAEFSQHFNLTYKSVSNWECGYIKPRDEYLLKMTKLTGIDFTDYYENKPEILNLNTVEGYTEHEINLIQKYRLLSPHYQITIEREIMMLLDLTQQEAKK